MTRRNIARIVRVASAVGLVLTAVLLAACTTQPAQKSEGGSESSPASAKPSTPPTVTLVSPTEGAEVPAGTVKVTVESVGIEYTMPSNTNVAGQGHVHFTLDDRPFEMSVEPSFDFEKVEPGEHTLVAELVQNNTESFDPPVKQEITFVVK